MFVMLVRPSDDINKFKESKIVTGPYKGGGAGGGRQDIHMIVFGSTSSKKMRHKQFNSTT